MVRPLRESISESLKACTRELRSSVYSAERDSVEYEPNQWCFRAVIYTCLSCMGANLNSSIMISFFPNAMHERGLDSIQTGILFSTFYVSNLIVQFLVPKLSKRLGGIRVMAFGNLFQAIVTASMSFTRYFHNPKHFFIACCLVRFLQGSMTAFTESSASRISMRSVPRNKQGEVISWLESFRVLGAVCGPILGGAFYSLLGFSAPFIMSSTLLFSLFFLMVFYPMDARVDDKPDEAEDRVGRREEGGFSSNCRLFQSQLVHIILISVFFLSAGLSFIEPIFQTMISEFPYDLTPVELGAVYIICVLFFATVSVRAGPLLTEYFGSIFTLFSSFFLAGMAYLVIYPPEQFVGPLSVFAFLHQSKRNGAIALAQGGMTLLGISSGLLLSPINKILVSEGEDIVGLDMTECSISTSWTLHTVYQMGAAIGPVLSGVMTHLFGLHKTCEVVGFSLLFLGFVVGIFISGIYVLRKMCNSCCRSSRQRGGGDTISLTSSLLEDDLSTLL